MNGSNLHTAWARLFVRALAASGVRQAVLSPGSRSTPLALALTDTREVTTHVVVDERSAAFFALGQARATGRASLLVCTSGTAGAHYYAAVLEAEASFVPLVVVTADRPWELHDCGASQTIAQDDLFGAHVRASFDLGPPDANALPAVARIAAQAAARALGPVPGPVHVNARFRKPLEPVDAGPEPWEPTYEALSAACAPRVLLASPAFDGPVADVLAERIARAERPLLVCGPASVGARAGREAVFALAARLAAPLFAEATSQLRFAPTPADVTRIAHGGELFRRLAPDLVVQLGVPPVAAGYAELLAGCSRRIVVAPHVHADPWSSAELVVDAPVGVVARALVERLPSRAASSWTRAVADADRLAAAAISAEVEDGAFGEGAVARAVLDACADGSFLVVGNSTPVRDLDTYCACTDRSIAVVHQRGVAGIDGLVAGTAGVRSATDAPVTLLIGDVSLVHDIGSLYLVANAERPVTVVVVQNGGGRIFDELPVVAAAPEAFERCFAAPQSIDLCAVAAAFGLATERVTTRADLVSALERAATRSVSTLIEAVVPPREGARRRRRIAERILPFPLEGKGAGGLG